MARVRVEIVRYTDDHQPGFVECRLTDVAGRDWSFEEKVPVVGTEYLDAASQYPRSGSMGCTVLGRDGAAVRIGVDPISDYFECVVQGALECFMGVVYIAMGPLMAELMRVSPSRPGSPPPPEDVMGLMTIVYVVTR